MHVKWSRDTHQEAVGTASFIYYSGSKVSVSMSKIICSYLNRLLITSKTQIPATLGLHRDLVATHFV